MTSVAQGAVFVKSECVDGASEVVGPKQYGASNLAAVLAAYPTIGFQATNLGKAVTVAQSMLTGRGDDSVPQTMIFVGATANLFGTGVRESLKFVIEHKLIDCVVVTGGGLEHDIRRAVNPEGYTIDEYASSSSCSSSSFGHFGNVSYDKHNARYKALMKVMLREVILTQQAERARAASEPVPNEYFDVCTWAWSPSDVWRAIGLALPQHMPLAVAETTAVYWGAKNGIPLYSPSFSDGDVMTILDELEADDPNCVLKLDLVQDIHKLNKSAMGAQKTGMIILGGGVAKHHVCNANLMRNGADLSIFVNSAQEFDGSDAGARPDEAVSWGKIRMDGVSVKVYAEISLAFPLIVVQAFVPFVREVAKRLESKDELISQS